MMNSPFLLLICWMLVFTSQSFAQNSASPTQTLGIQLGYDRTFFQDANFSPLHYGGDGLAFRISYAKETAGRHLFLTEIGYAQVKLQAAAARFAEAQNVVGHLRAHYLLPIGGNQQRISMKLGGGLVSHIDNTIFEDSDAISYLNLHGIEVAYLVAYQLSPRHHLQATASLPIIGLLVRPPYTGWDVDSFERSGLELAYRGKLTSFQDFFGLTLAASYRYQMSGRISWEMQGRWQYYQTSQLTAATTAHLQLSGGAVISL
ncbi:MAG: hypothetical protein AAF399_00050 [Bacteroidota bacterium]